MKAYVKNQVRIVNVNGRAVAYHGRIFYGDMTGIRYAPNVYWRDVFISRPIDVFRRLQRNYKR